jgi:hypothetical protein
MALLESSSPKKKNDPIKSNLKYYQSKLSKEILTGTYSAESNSLQWRKHNVHLYHQVSKEVNHSHCKTHTHKTSQESPAAIKKLKSKLKLKVSDFLDFREDQNLPLEELREEEVRPMLNVVVSWDAYPCFYVETLLFSAFPFLS